MIERTGNIWDYYDQGAWVVITTNGSIRKDGTAVMGRGVAFDTAIRFPRIPEVLGQHIGLIGNKVHCFSRFRLITFPVKHFWMGVADPLLIEESCATLKYLVDTDTLLYYDFGWRANIVKPVYMVRPGCGNGKLNWRDVKPILDKHLNDDRFIVVEKEAK